MSSLIELAERIESAAGPDRQLDDAIWLAENRAGRGSERGGWLYDLEPAPGYTASIDAAMTLLPIWCGIVRWKIWPDEPSTLDLYKVLRGPSGFLLLDEITAATPALAICAAALRSRGEE